MRICKKCGGQYSLWTARGDGLCKQCGAAADQAARAEAERKETERKQRVFEGALQNLELIRKALTDEPLLVFTFINRGITTKTSTGLGIVIGGALGGIAGAMIGNALDGGGSTTHSGEIGAVAVTANQVIVAYFASPVLSARGALSLGHLEIFLKKLKANQVQRRTFDIRKTHLARGTAEADTTVTLDSGSEALSFQTSELYVNDAHYVLPSAAAVHDAIAQGGPLATPTQFLIKLGTRENAVTEEQFCRLGDGGAYLGVVFAKLLQHPRRDILVGNRDCLAPSVKRAIEDRLRDRVASAAQAKIALALSLAFGTAGAAAFAFVDGGLCLLCVVGVIVCAIVGISSVASLRTANWCRNVLHGGTTPVHSHDRLCAPGVGPQLQTETTS